MLPLGSAGKTEIYAGVSPGMYAFAPLVVRLPPLTLMPHQLPFVDGYLLLLLTYNSRALLTCTISCLRLVSRAFALVEFKLAKTTLERMPIMAITTRSSISVNPADFFRNKDITHQSTAWSLGGALFGYMIFEPGGAMNLTFGSSLLENMKNVNTTASTTNPSSTYCAVRSSLTRPPEYLRMSPTILGICGCRERAGRSSLSESRDGNSECWSI